MSIYHLASQQRTTFISYYSILNVISIWGIRFLKIKKELTLCSFLVILAVFTELTNKNCGFQSHNYFIVGSILQTHWIIRTLTYWLKIRFIWDWRTMEWPYVTQIPQLYATLLLMPVHPVRLIHRTRKTLALLITATCCSFRRAKEGPKN